MVLDGKLNIEQLYPRYHQFWYSVRSLVYFSVCVVQIGVGVVHEQFRHSRTTRSFEMSM